MKNRDWFLKTATIDRLMKMNDNLNKLSCDTPCVMKCLEPERGCLYYSCYECLCSWLNEERKNANK